MNLNYHLNLMNLMFVMILKFQRYLMNLLYLSFRLNLMND